MKKPQKLKPEEFVLAAIAALPKMGNSPGIHMQRSGILDALYMYYDGERNPVKIILELIHKGVVLAKPAKEGFMIYDPASLKDRPSIGEKVAKETTVEVVKLDTEKDGTWSMDMLREIFAFSKCASMMTGFLIFSFQEKTNPHIVPVVLNDIDHEEGHLITVTTSDQKVAHVFRFTHPQEVPFNEFHEAIQHGVNIYLDSRTAYKPSLSKKGAVTGILQKILEQITTGKKDEDVPVTDQYIMHVIYLKEVMKLLENLSALRKKIAKAKKKKAKKEGSYNELRDKKKPKKRKFYKAGEELLLASEALVKLQSDEKRLIEEQLVKAAKKHYLLPKLVTIFLEK